MSNPAPPPFDPSPPFPFHLCPLALLQSASACRGSSGRRGGTLPSRLRSVPPSASLGACRYAYRRPSLCTLMNEGIPFNLGHKSLNIRNFGLSFKITDNHDHEKLQLKFIPIFFLLQKLPPPQCANRFVLCPPHSYLDSAQSHWCAKHCMGG